MLLMPSTWPWITHHPVKSRASLPIVAFPDSSCYCQHAAAPCSKMAEQLQQLPGVKNRGEARMNLSSEFNAAKGSAKAKKLFGVSNGTHHVINNERGAI